MNNLNKVKIYNSTIEYLERVGKKAREDLKREGRDLKNDDFIRMNENSINYYETLINNIKNEAKEILKWK